MDLEVFAAIPPSLKAVPQWIVYKLVRGDGKTDKLPIDHRTGRVHDAHDPAIWMTFDLAVMAAPDHDGIGFVFTTDDPFTGIDLDKCIAADGRLEPWAELVIDCFASYCEFSPSGTGVHVWIRGRLPDGTPHVCNGQGADKRGKIEVYDRKRFFTVTGRRLGTIAEIFDRQEEFSAFCRARFPRPEPVRGETAEPDPSGLSDEDVIRMARMIRSGARFGALFDDGDLAAFDGDPSRADMALVNFLAFWTGGDVAAIDRLFRRSALMRDKWDEKRGKTTYGGYTIAKVLKTIGGSYHAATEKPAVAGEKVDKFPLVVQASTIEPVPVEWLWTNRIPRGFISIFAGRTGIGKSFVTLDIVARVTTGAVWPDLPGECAPTGNVLILSEDPQKQVLVPRLIAMGADLERVWFMTWAAMSRYTLTDTETLGKAVGMSGEPILIIIDPPTNFMGAIDEHRNAEVRAVLMHLVAWLEGRAAPVAMILITHVSKAAKGVDAIARVIGSVAWVSTSRIAHVFAPDPDHPGQALFLESKNNLGPLAKGLAYRVVKTETFARVEWLGTVTTSADDAMSGEKQKPVAIDAADWVIERFRERREWRSEDLKRASVAAGYSANAIFKNKRIQKFPIKKDHIFPGDGTSFWTWTAQGDWPGIQQSESSESSESYSVSPYDISKNKTFGCTDKQPESTEQPESFTEELSDFPGSTFGGDILIPESLERDDLPRVYDPTFGTFGTFGCAPPWAREVPSSGAGTEDQDLPSREGESNATRSLVAFLFGNGSVPLDEIGRRATRSGISHDALYRAADTLNVTKILIDGQEFWSLGALDG